MILTIEEARVLLGDKDLTDEEVEQLIHELEVFSEIVLEIATRSTN